jgi:hypothetical protein
VANKEDQISDRDGFGAPTVGELNSGFQLAVVSLRTLQMGFMLTMWTTCSRTISSISQVVSVEGSAVSPETNII